jgi:HPt (histidine-containing phosphotransfer) domain-containing protein
MNLNRRSHTILDASVLNELVGGNGAMRDQLLSSFMEEAEHKLEELKSASAEGRVSDVRIAAHQLSGAARIVGAIALAESARRLEGLNVGDTSEIEDARRYCADLDQELRRFRGALSVPL